MIDGIGHTRTIVCRGWGIVVVLSLFSVGAGIHDDLGEFCDLDGCQDSSSTLCSAAWRSLCNEAFWDLSSSTSARRAGMVRLDSIITLSTLIESESKQLVFATNKRSKKLARRCVCNFVDRGQIERSGR